MNHHESVFWQLWFESYFQIDHTIYFNLSIFASLFLPLKLISFRSQFSIVLPLLPGTLGAPKVAVPAPVLMGSPPMMGPRC